MHVQAKNAKSAPNDPIHSEMKRNFFLLYGTPLSHSPTKKSEWREAKILFNAFLAILGCFEAFYEIWLIFYKQGGGGGSAFVFLFHSVARCV